MRGSGIWVSDLVLPLIGRVVLRKMTLSFLISVFSASKGAFFLWPLPMDHKFINCTSYGYQGALLSNGFSVGPVVALKVTETSWAYVQNFRKFNFSIASEIVVSGMKIEVRKKIKS